MDNSAFIRNTIIQNLKKEKDFDGMVAAELNGFHFSAADIALLDNDGNCEVYRIAVIKHNQTTGN